MLTGYLKLDPLSAPLIDTQMGIELRAGQVVQVDLTSPTLLLQKSISMGQVVPATADEYRTYIETGSLLTLEDYTAPPVPPIPLTPSPFSDGFDEGFQKT